MEGKALANSRPFMDMLREHMGGQTHDELSDALQALVAEVTEQGKSGSLTLTITIKPIGKKNSAGLEVGAEVKSKPPKGAPGVSIFYASPDNNLVRQDPRQQTMELRGLPPASVPRSLA